MPRPENSFRAWWPGQDEEQGDLADRLLAPRGNTARTPEDWAATAKDVLKPLPSAGLPGLWVHGVSPAELEREQYRAWKDAAQAAANARGDEQVVVTTRNLGGHRDR